MEHGNRPEEEIPQAGICSDVGECIVFVV